MKALFITQSAYFSKSIITHVLNTDDNVDLLINERVIGNDINVKYAQEMLGERVNNLYRGIIPVSNCYIGKSLKITKKILSFTKGLFNPLFLLKINKIINNGNYDYIYVNSLTLHKIISKDHPYIIHVRERYDGADDTVFSSLMKAKGIIFIDNAVSIPFKNLLVNKKIIINNPIDMSKDDIHKLKTNIDTSKTIFSVIGRIENEKGIPMIIESFKNSNVDAILLIVGFGEPDYIKMCKTIAGDDKRIIFYGVEEHIQIIYDITDYVIRGESEQCIGRTIYEGLYSGCNVIIPGNDIKCLFEYDDFKNNIHFYKPLDKNELTNYFIKFSGKKIINREYKSNVKEYIKEIDNFIKECLND